jgi:hypothetical protein
MWEFSMSHIYITLCETESGERNTLAVLEHVISWKKDLRHSCKPLGVLNMKKRTEIVILKRYFSVSKNVIYIGLAITKYIIVHARL